MVSQPIANADVYHLRFILHDWSDHDCRRILGVLRTVASPHSKLLIIDKIVPHACDYDSVLPEDSGSRTAVPLVEGADAAGRPPLPLLANGGFANYDTYGLDLQMFVGLNGQERTLEQLEQVLTSAGWKLQKVFRSPYFVGDLDQALAIPA